VSLQTCAERTDLEVVRHEGYPRQHDIQQDDRIVRAVLHDVVGGHVAASRKGLHTHRAAWSLCKAEAARAYVRGGWPTNEWDELGWDGLHFNPHLTWCRKGKRKDLHAPPNRIR